MSKAIYRISIQVTGSVFNFLKMLLASDESVRNILKNTLP